MVRDTRWESTKFRGLRHASHPVNEREENVLPSASANVGDRNVSMARVKRGLRKRRQTPTAHMQRSNATCSPQPRYLPLLWVDSRHHPTATSPWCLNVRNNLPRLRCRFRKGIHCHKYGRAGALCLAVHCASTMGVVLRSRQAWSGLVVSS